MFIKRRLWLIGVALIIAAGGIIAYVVTTSAGTAAAQTEPEVQTTVVRQGDITISATGAGTVIAADEVQLGFSSAGVLEELLVKVGDDVKAGDALARQDDGSAQEALAAAQLQLSQTEMKTDASATQTGVSFDDISIEQARLNLETAQATLDDLRNWQPDEGEAAKAEANLAAAQAGYNAALGQEASKGYSNDVVAISLEQAQRDLAAAQTNYDAAWDEARDWETFWDEPICDPGEKEPCTGQTWAQRIENDRQSSANALVRAQDNLAIAEANYNASVSGSASSSSASARASLVSAQSALEEVQTAPSEEEVEAAERAVRQAELSWQQALLNQESDAASLAQAELNVEAAQKALDETILIAPMNGTVMAINASVGEVASGDLLTLADLEQPLLEVYLDETDMNMIGLGYEVEVVFDALPDDMFSGQVVLIDPQLTSNNGVSAVRALVQLNEDSFAKPQTLPVGMNATVEVIGGRALGTLLVPVEALREIEAGQYAVFVMVDGEPQLRMVEVGLMDYTSAQILSGLKAGDTVTTGIVQTN